MVCVAFYVNYCTLNIGHLSYYYVY